MNVPLVVSCKFVNKISRFYSFTCENKKYEYFSFFLLEIHYQKFRKMPRNVEIKAFVSCMSSLRSKAAELSKSDGVEIMQSDTFFTTNQGRLKLRHLIGTDAQLVYYDRSDKEGPKLSNYHIVTTNQPEELSKVLSKALGVRGEVHK